MAGRPKSRAKKNRAIAVHPSPEDFERFKAAGIACGYDSNTMERLVARCQGKPPSAKGRFRFDDQELSALIDDRLAQMFEYFDDHMFSKMSGRDLLVGAGILIDKRQLLKGEPTAITRFQDMRKLDELAEALDKELKRRGKLVDVTPEAAAEPAANAGNGGAP